MRAGLLGSAVAATLPLGSWEPFPISEPQFPPPGSGELFEMTQWEGPAWCLGALEAWGRQFPICSVQVTTWY